jgi:Ribonuclease G/E
MVDVHPNVANFLYDEARGDVERIERRFNKRIIVTGKNDYHLEQYEIHSRNGQFPADKKER